MRAYTEAPLDPALQRAVGAALLDGERAVWAGQPVPARLVRQALPVVAFGVPWTAFAVFWAWMAAGPLREGAAEPVEVLFPLFGLPFVLVGLGLLSLPYWAHRGARRTVYVVTDRRALVFAAEGLGGTAVRAFGPAELRAPRVVRRADGSGDVVFARDQWRDSDGDPRGTDVGFLAVPDVADAEAAVRRLAGAATPGAAAERAGPAQGASRSSAHAPAASAT